MLGLPGEEAISNSDARTCLIFSPGAKQRVGHANDYTRGLCQGLLHEGVAPTAVCIDGPLVIHSGVSEILVAACEYAKPRGPIGQIRWGIRRTFAHYGAARVLFDAVKANNPSFVILETFDYLSMALFMPRLARRLPVLVIFHDTNFNFAQSSRVAGLYKASVARFAARFIATRAARVFAHGATMVDNLRHLLWLQNSLWDRKMMVLQYGSPHPDDLGNGAEIDVAPTLGEVRTPRVLLSFGTLRLDKDYAALFRLLSALDGWVATFAGPEGDMSYDELRSLAASYDVDDRLVIHPLFVPEDEQVEMFSAADLVAGLYLPHIRHESGTAQRARSFLKPVVVSGPPDLIDYVANNGVGFVLRPLNIQSVAEEIDLTMRDPAKLSHLLGRVHDAAIRNSWRAVASRLTDGL